MKPAEVAYDPAWGLFPTHDGVDPAALRMSDVGMYSIAKPWLAHDLARAVDAVARSLGLDPAALTATETHGGVGGFSLQLAPLFRHLSVVEIEPLHADIIEHNLAAYGLGGRADVVRADYLDVMHTLRQDVIVSDPPWGGPAYARGPPPRLLVGRRSPASVINELYRRRAFAMYVLFAPDTFDTGAFLRALESRRVVSCRLGRHFAHIVLGRGFD